MTIIRTRVAAGDDSDRQENTRLAPVENGASTAQLIHLTHQESLEAHPGLFGSPHSSTTEAHLCYLKPGPVKAISTIPFPDLQVLAPEQSIRPGPGRGQKIFRQPVPSSPELDRQVRATDQDRRYFVIAYLPTPSSVIPPHHPPLSSAVFPSLLLFSTVPCRPTTSPVVLCSYLLSLRRGCPKSWGSPSCLITAVQGIQVLGRTTLYGPAARPDGAPDS